jgi:hypothetical protein
MIDKMNPQISLILCISSSLLANFILFNGLELYLAFFQSEYTSRKTSGKIIPFRHCYLCKDLKLECF